jgi:hypothetical protein
MPWAQTRKTTREKDMVYLLLGIFGIYMLPNYGEGKDNALKRLREEIEKPKRRYDYIDEAHHSFTNYII